MDGAFHCLRWVWWKFVCLLRCWLEMGKSSDGSSRCGWGWGGRKLGRKLLLNNFWMWPCLEMALVLLHIKALLSSWSSTAGNWNGSPLLGQFEFFQLLSWGWLWWCTIDEWLTARLTDWHRRYHLASKIYLESKSSQTLTAGGGGELTRTGKEK